MTGIERLMSEVLCLVQLSLSWSFGHKEQGFVGYCLIYAHGISELMASLAPSLAHIRQNKHSGNSSPGRSSVPEVPSWSAFSLYLSEFPYVVIYVMSEVFSCALWEERHISAYADAEVLYLAIYLSSPCLPTCPQRPQAPVSPDRITLLQSSPIAMLVGRVARQVKLGSFWPHMCPHCALPEMLWGLRGVENVRNTCEGKGRRSKPEDSKKIRRFS